MLILTFHVNRDLFKFAKVCHKAILVNSTMQESSTATFTSATGNQDQINVALDRLPVNETLHEVRAPELRDILRKKLCVHISVPTKVFLDVVLRSEAMLCVKCLLPL